jgi:hypothetical protein
LALGEVLNVVLASKDWRTQHCRSECCHLSVSPGLISSARTWEHRRSEVWLSLSTCTASSRKVELGGRLDVAVTRGLTPLVGRESEVTLLQERWQQAKSGQGQVVLLSGDAGIGKSRLVQTLKDHVAHEPHNAGNVGVQSTIRTQHCFLSQTYSNGCYSSTLRTPQTRNWRSSNRRSASTDCP